MKVRRGKCLSPVLFHAVPGEVIPPLITLDLLLIIAESLSASFQWRSCFIPVTAVFEIRSDVFPEFDVVLRVTVAALFFRFSGSQHCGHVHCAYQYREHYHCMDPDCNYQVSVWTYFSHISVYLRFSHQRAINSSVRKNLDSC